jgi:CheY-like chemotaxis protein
LAGAVSSSCACPSWSRKGRRPARPRPSGLQQTPTLRRILVVDDSEDSAASLAMLLTILGNETRTAHDGLEAVDAAERFRPEIVLLDIGLPRLNGYEAARRIREQPWGKNMVRRRERLGAGRRPPEVEGRWLRGPHGQAGQSRGPHEATSGSAVEPEGRLGAARAGGAPTSGCLRFHRARDPCDARQRGPPNAGIDVAAPRPGA